jgi:RimJ/RimL family protein N-acetyltransferase
VLRAWRDEDLAPFAAMNADPRVMEHFPSVLTREESDAMVGRIRAAMEKNGFGFWAVEVPGVADFVGFIGLSIPSFAAPFMPCVEIGWRIAVEHWDKGIATEGARAALDAAFGELGLSEVVSFTVTGNTRSRRVMERLGMRHDAREDFDHPNVPEGHPLRRHVLYRIRTR